MYGIKYNVIAQLEKTNMADKNDIENPREEDEEEAKPWYHIFPWNKKNDQSENDVDQPEDNADQPEDEEETKRWYHIFCCNKKNPLYNYLTNDHSWACIFTSFIVFGFVMGLIAALTYTDTGIYEYFNPPPFVPPNIFYSVEYLSPGIRYDFYEKKETIETARKICASRKSTPLYFTLHPVSQKSLDEENAFDCYMNFRNNAEDRNIDVWLNETLLRGGPPGVLQASVRYSSFQLTDQHETANSVVEEWRNLTTIKNGCSIMKDFHNLLKNITEEMKSEMVTELSYVKRYGNHGLREKNDFITNLENGCWHEVTNATEKHHVVCRKELSDDKAYRTAVSRDPILKGWNYDPNIAESKFWHELCPKTKGDSRYIPVLKIN